VVKITDKKSKRTNDIIEQSKKPVGLIFFLVFWVAIVLIGFIFGGVELAGGLILAAIISAILYKMIMNSEYSGEIIDFEVKKYTDDDGMMREIRKAVLKLDNGKTKKISPMPDWKKGDKIIKKKGETMPSKV